MHPKLGLLFIALFSIFLGAQITEGILLVPYWQSLEPLQFYKYYTNMGPIISRFYTVLTVVATLISIYLSIYSFYKKPKAFNYALVASLCMAFCIALFYLYFKNTNQQFMAAYFKDTHLKEVLLMWSYWHWIRILVEILALTCLVQAIYRTTQKNKSI